jgi:hypothetical protein
MLFAICFQTVHQKNNKKICACVGRKEERGKRRMKKMKEKERKERNKGRSKEGETECAA